MKTTKFYGIISFLLIAITIISCVEDGEFDVPNITVEEPNIIANSNISAIKSALQQEYNASGDLIYTFYDNENNPTYVEGYVVSTDAAGNFYKKIIIQDNAENATAGIEVILNKTSLNETYELGRKVYIKLDGLTVSYDDGESANYINPTNSIPGKYVLGVLSGDQVDDIPSTSVDKHIFRSATVSTIVPNSIELSAITGDHINTMIQLNSAQIEKTDLGKTFQENQMKSLTDSERSLDVVQKKQYHCKPARLQVLNQMLSLQVKELLEQYYLKTTEQSF